MNCIARLTVGIGLLAPALALAASDEAIFWNNVGLKVVKSAMIPPPLIARNLAISSIAQFDASAAVRRTRVSYLYKGMTDEVGVPEDAAVAYAAYLALKGSFKEYAYIVEEAWRRRLPEFKKKKHWYEAKRIGEEAATAILRARQDDYALDAQYTDNGGTGIGEWRPVKILEEPDLKRYEPSVLPGWKLVRPFAIPDSKVCYPAGFNQTGQQGICRSRRRGPSIGRKNEQGKNPRANPDRPILARTRRHPHTRGSVERPCDESRRQTETYIPPKPTHVRSPQRRPRRCRNRCMGL